MATKGKAKYIDLYIWNLNNLTIKVNVLAEKWNKCLKDVSNLKCALLICLYI